MRKIRALFAAQASLLPTSLAAGLRTMLEEHQALRAFYPAVARHYEAIRFGRNEEPLPLDAVEGFVRAIAEAPGSLIGPSVGSVFADSASAVPDITPPPPPDPRTVPADVIFPPPDAEGEINPRKQRDLLVASAANGFWKIFTKGKAANEAIEGWTGAFNSLALPVGKLIDWLQRNFPNGLPPGMF